MLNGKMTDMAITFGSLFLIQKIDFKDNPQNVFYAQCVFGAVQVSILLIYLYIFNSIKAKPNNSIVRVPVNPPSMFSKPDPNEPTTEQTASEYDLAQLKKCVSQSFVTIGITVFLFFKMGIIQPLAMQSIMAPQNLLKNKLFKLYVLKQDESKFKRPWVEENPFSMTPQNDEQKDTTSDNGNVTIESSKKDAKENTVNAIKANTTTKRSTVPSKAKVTEISDSESDSSSSEEEGEKKKTKKKYL